MEKIKGLDPNIAVSCSFEEPAKRSPEECGFIPRIAEPTFDPGDILLYRDLGIQHVWLGEINGSTGFQYATDLPQRWLDFQMMQNLTTHHRIERGI